MGFLSPIRTVLLFIAIACLSVVAVPRLSVDLLPKDHSTQFIVAFSVTNATPDVVEQQATSLLEGVLAQLSQLKSINSVSNYNEGRITLLFDRKVDMEFKQFEVNALIRQVFPSLPSGVSYPEVQRSGGGENAAIRQSPLLVYTIEGPAAAFQIKKIAEETFRKALAEVKGLREVQISGTEDIQLRINFYPERLQAYGISPQQIESTLQEHFATTYPGAVRTKQGEEYFLALKGRPYVVGPSSGRPPRVAPTEIESIHLQGKNGTSIPLKALAEVYLEEQEPQQFFRINGKTRSTSRSSRAVPKTALYWPKPSNRWFPRLPGVSLQATAPDWIMTTPNTWPKNCKRPSAAPPFRWPFYHSLSCWLTATGGTCSFC